jgi:hypothetical protein
MPGNHRVVVINQQKVKKKHKKKIQGQQSDKEKNHQVLLVKTNHPL